MLPHSLAIVEDDPEYAEYLGQYLSQRGVSTRVFGDSNDLLADVSAFSFGAYVLDLTLPGVDGIELIRILRKRTQAGILVVSGRLAREAFEQAISAGADMHLAKPVSFEQVELAITAIQRRVGPMSITNDGWTMDRAAGELLAPDGARIPLSGTDQVVLQCFAEAHGAVVTKEQLNQCLGRPSQAGADNGLNATIYRLRRRIEQVTPLQVPLQSQHRVGYWFRAPLQVL